MKKNKLNNEKRKLALKGFEKFFEQENNIYRKEYYLQKTVCQLKLLQDCSISLGIFK